MSTTIVSTTQLGPLDCVNGPRIDDLIRLFLSGKKESTLVAYRAALRDFVRFVNAASIGNAASALLHLSLGEANRVALEYRADLIGRDLAPATINLRLSAMRALTKLARTIGVIDWALEIASVRNQSYRDVRGPNISGIRQLFAQAERRSDAKGLRDQAILHLCFDLGLRRAEIAAIDVGDIDLENSVVRVIGKGQAMKTAMTLPTQAVDAIKQWLAARSNTDGPDIALFVNFDKARKGRRLTGRSICRVVGQLGNQVGIQSRPHNLRHAAVTVALDATGGNIRDVQRFARHRDPKVTLRYDDCRRDVAGRVAAIVAQAGSGAEEDHPEHSGDDV